MSYHLHILVLSENMKAVHFVILFLIFLPLLIQSSESDICQRPDLLDNCGKCMSYPQCRWCAEINHEGIIRNCLKY